MVPFFPSSPFHPPSDSTTPGLYVHVHKGGFGLAQGARITRSKAWDRESAIKRAGSPDATGKIYVVLDIIRQGIL